MRSIFFGVLAAAFIGILVGCAKPTSATGHATTSPFPAPSKALSGSNEQTVERLLGAQYSDGFDAKHRCWRVQHAVAAGDPASYCMRVTRADRVKTAKGERIYIALASASDIRDDTRYLYSSDAPGLFGAFEFDAGKTPRLIAGTRDMEYGTAGACGCDHPQFSQLGNERNGWIFTSGGTWQGVTVSNYAIVTPRDGTMVDVSRIPEIKEEAQNVAYDLVVDASKPTASWFALSVTAHVDGQPADYRSVEYDKTVGAYELPTNF